MTVSMVFAAVPPAAITRENSPMLCFYGNAVYTISSHIPAPAFLTRDSPVLHVFPRISGFLCGV
jgi:hypothetical protein